jgi:hypothetical protein
LGLIVQENQDQETDFQTWGSCLIVRPRSFAK